MSTTFGTRTGRFQSTWQAQMQQMPRDPYKFNIPWVDVKGFARIDVYREWTPDGAFLVVCLKCSNEVNNAGQWVRMETVPVPRDMATAERKLAKKACAELVAVKIGLPYKLRGTL